MNITLIQIGKTEAQYLVDGVAEYEKRLKHYIHFETITIPATKSNKQNSTTAQKESEGALVLTKLKAGDVLVLLDDKGQHYTSPQFATFLQQKMNAGTKGLVFVIGGPFGFSDELYARAQSKLSLSKLTFSHQMVRLFFVEQLYRGFSILKNEKYHHE